MADYLLPMVRRLHIAEDTVELTFNTGETGYQFEAGQYAYFFLPNHEPRLFSFVSAPGELPLIRIAMRVTPSQYKHDFIQLPIGSMIAISRAIGIFQLPQDATTPVCCIAGGIGIAPFISLLAEAHSRGKQHTIRLFVSNQTRTSVAYRETIAQLEKQNPNMQSHWTLTRENQTEGFSSGRLSMHAILRTLPEAQRTHFYLAGTPALVETFTDQLIEAEMPPHHIFIESFTGY